MGSCLVSLVQAAVPAVSAGGDHTLALRSDGIVLAWGRDEQGQLGIGRLLSSSTPVAVPGLDNVIAVACGNDHTLALTAVGTVYSWGQNFNAQLGDGSRTARSLPSVLPTLTGVVAIAAGTHHSLALKADGTVYQWGDGTSADRPRPERVPGLADIVAISGGFGHSVALRRDGTVWKWGRYDPGAGDGREVPVQVPGVSNVVSIAAGSYHVVAADGSGDVWSWGDNSNGQLGDGGAASRATPSRITGVKATQLAAGESHTLALSADGTVKYWGRLGPDSNVPRAVNISGVRRIVSGLRYAIALKSDGTAWAWGDNTFGQLGNGTTVSSYLDPVALPAFRDATEISAGYGHTVAIRSGRLLASGRNDVGQLGVGTRILSSVPLAVSGISGVKAIATGNDHSMALREDGTVWTWGSNSYGQLGDGSDTSKSTPVQVPALGGVVAIAAGFAHSVALKGDGSVWTWGFNDNGQLGDGTSGFDRRWTPTQVPGLSNVVAVSAGSDFFAGYTLALMGDGTVWAWGSNFYGQLGDGTKVQRSSPGRVVGISDVSGISAGGLHALALKRDGSAWAWGANHHGQLGDGSRVDRSNAAPVAGLTGIAAISAGHYHSMAVSSDGALLSWGANGFGALGDGTAIDRLSPVAVHGPARPTGISAGDQSHSAVVDHDGAVWAWGFNQYGQIGDGTLARRLQPVVVLREDGAGNFDGDDWFLDLDPGVAGSVALDKAFAMVVEGSVGENEANVSAQIRPRTADAGSTGSVYVFALAPATIVNGASVMSAKAGIQPAVFAKSSDGKDTPVQCVLAQLTSAGQLVAVSATSLQAYLTGALTSQMQAVTLLNGVPTTNIGGATFYVGYGSSGAAMLGAGTNRSAATVPGQVNCSPQAPQTGWWWNPAEDGRGFSIEVRGTNLFFAAFLYDVSGRSTWHVATGPVSLDGSLFQGNLLSARGGQTLGGAYSGFPAISNAGAITLAFNDAATGTMVWPGGAVPIQRFNIVANGINLPQNRNMPQNGWWWNESESGRGFFMEWQGDVLDIAGYMYDENGDPVWYLTVERMSGVRQQGVSGSWWSFAGGQTLTGAWKPNTRINANVAPVTIQFSGPETAIMTLPNGRTTNLTRHRF